MRKELISTSKFLSLVLRHEPAKIGLHLDAEGWADVEHLLAQASAHGVRIDRPQLEEIVATNEKRRFRFSGDGTRIRASQGHSIEVKLGLPPVKPPPVLFHGTATRFWDSIQKAGLLKGTRQHVHLSADVATAHAVGMRHGKPMVLAIDAKQMHLEGHIFHLSDNGVWLVAHVPVRFVGVTEQAS